MTAGKGMAKSKGFTLIELLIALALSAIVGTVTISAIRQFVNVSAAEQDTMAVNTQIKILSSMLSQDLICANSGEVLDDGQTLVLYLSSFEFGELIDPVTYSISYSLIDSEIIRTTGDGSVSVARGVQSVNFGQVGALSDVCTISVTFSIGDVVESTTITLDRRPS